MPSVACGSLNPLKQVNDFQVPDEYDWEDETDRVLIP